MSTMSTTKTFLWFFSPLVPLLLLISWYLWLPPLLLVLLVRHLLKPQGQKVTDRNWVQAKRNERQHRINTAIQMHLAANGLPNTPENRAWAISSLSRSRASGRGR